MRRKKVFVAMSSHKSLRDLAGQAGGVRKTKVFVAMSGGVDSSVAAALMQERGFDVTGIHIKMWSDPEIPCNFKEDRYDAMRAAAHLGIPFETWDFTDEYRKRVVDYMIREYAAGRTPNPDIMCNRHIKFGIFLNHALRKGVDYIATGHYVRKSQIPNPKSQTNSKFKFQNSKLLVAKDLSKDQSYFLWTLNQDKLKHCLFPIGEYIKPEVREMARKFGLPNAEKPDSQGVCFIGEIDMREFLKKHIPSSPGKMLTTSGAVIGEHEGLSFYTIGQRHNLGVGGGRPAERGEPRPKGAGGIPYYVAEKDFSANTLKVAEGPYDENLFSEELITTDVNWISGRAPKLPLRCEARIRYRHPVQRCRVEPQTYAEYTQTNAENSSAKIRVQSASVRVIFDEPQRAVTPGQSVVFYRGEEMLGGGIITR